MKTSFSTHTDDTFVNRSGRVVPVSHLLCGIDREANRYSVKGGAELPVEDIEDIWIDAACKAWRSRESYNPELNHGTPEAFGYTVFRREAWRHHAKRLQKREQLSTLKSSIETSDGCVPSWITYQDGGNHEPDRELETSEALDYIYSKIDLLCKEQKDVLLLKIKGLKPRQIAAELGLTANAVSSRLTRGTTRLKALLGNEFMSNYGYGLCA